MKAILVIDIPENCFKCPILCDFKAGNGFRPCRAENCPLRPVPSEYCVSNKADQYDNERWFYGYNRAIRDIVGDENIEY